MAKPVANAADIVPGQAGAQAVRIISESDGCLADEQKLALGGGHGLRVPAKPLEIHAVNDWAIMSMLSRISRSESAASLKGKNRLA